MQHEWKGEIRELENIIERAVIFCGGEFITLNDLPDFLHADWGVPVPVGRTSLETAINDFEKQYIVTILRKNDFNKEQTARDLQISLPTLYRRIKDLGITH
jgi:DNA-binding NtrC family response regulator